MPEAQSFPTYAIIGVGMVFVLGIMPFVAAILSAGQWSGKVTNAANEAKEKAAEAIRAAERAEELARLKAQDLSNALMLLQREVQTEYVRHGALDKLEKTMMDALKDMRAFMERVLLPPKGPHDE